MFGNLIRTAGVVAAMLAFISCDAGAFLAPVEDGTPETETALEVAAVVASPSSQTFASLGATRQITATGRDNLDQAVPGVNFSFASTDPAVVGVDSTGTMTANSLGAAAIIVAAMGTGFTDTVQAQVDTTAAQPIFSDDFESGDLTHTENGASWAGGEGQSAGATNPRTGAYALEILFPGDGGTDGDGFSYANLDLGGQYTELWAEGWVYIPDNYIHRESASSTNNKFFQFYGQRSTPDKLWVAVETIRGGDRSSGFSLKRDNNFNITVHIDFGREMITDTDIGQWNQFRMHVKMGTYDNNDGVAEVWWNGALVMSNYAADIYQDPNQSGDPWFDTIRILGWSNSGFTDDTRFDWDDIKVYAADPGWK